MSRVDAADSPQAGAGWDLSFLGRVYYSSVIAHFAMRRQATLPVYYGTSLRGALGYRVRERLGDSHPIWRDCFAKEHAVRPLAIAPEPPASLAELLAGAAIKPPYRLNPGGQGVSLLEIPRFTVRRGDRLRVRFTALGEWAALLPDVVAALAAEPIHVDEAEFELAEISDPEGETISSDGSPFLVRNLGRLLALAERPATFVRLVLLSPLYLNLSQTPSRSADSAVAALLEAALVRASRLAVPRPPFLALPSSLPEAAERRLFPIQFERVSHAQRRRMVYSGVVGAIDLAGEVSRWLPLLAAAEILQLGQKTSAGFGQLRCLLAEE